MSNLIDPPQPSLQLDAGPHGVLMLHGLGANAIELAHLARHLYQDGLTVAVPNLPHYCFGSAPGTWEQWLESAREHYWALRERCETVAVVGLSMGATLALLLASEETPTALVLLSAALAYDGWAIPSYSGLLRLAPWLTFLKRYRYAEAEPFGIKNPEMRSRVKKALAQQHISEAGADELSYTQISQGMQLIDATWRQLQQVCTPTLFIHAADDETVHPRNIEWALKRIASPTKRIHYLGDCYHMITVDNERETVSAETAMFVKQCVNSELGRAVFELPSAQTPELRRWLRATRTMTNEA